MTSSTVGHKMTHSVDIPQSKHTSSCILELVLKNHPMGPEQVFYQDRYSLGGLFCRYLKEKCILVLWSLPKSLKMTCYSLWVHCTTYLLFIITVEPLF